VPELKPIKPPVSDTITNTKDRKSPDGQETGTLPVPELPLVPKEAIIRYGECLTTYEMDEISEYSQIYFVGQNSRKVEGCKGATHNCGFDDESGSYIKVLHDHLGYRYEILEVIGKVKIKELFSHFGDRETPAAGSYGPPPPFRSNFITLATAAVRHGRPSAI